jgi:ABC-type nitrate/sulfonate/bicarbonate transport system substrate-binding protein
MSKQRTWTSVACAAAVLLLAACGSSGGSSSDSKAGPYKLSEIDVTPGYFYLPSYVIRTDTGKAHNLTATATSVTGGGAAETQFAGGAGDILLTGMDTAVRLLETKAVDVTILGTVVSHNVTALVTKAGSPYKTLASLKGKNLGIFGVGGVTDLALRQQLLTHGINPSTEVHLVALGPPASQLAALESGSATAVQLTEPQLTQELDAGKVQIVDDMRGQPFAAVTVVARVSDIKKDPGAYCAYQESLSDAITKLTSDPSYAAKAGQALMGSTSDAADNLIEYKEATSQIWYTDGKFTQSQYNGTKQILIASGAFKAQGFPSYQALVAANPKC